MQYVFFKIGVWGIFENFCVKSKLTVCKVTFNCKLQKKLGLQDVLVAPPIILWGPLLPRFPRLCVRGMSWSSSNELT